MIRQPAAMAGVRFCHRGPIAPWCVRLGIGNCAARSCAVSPRWRRPGETTRCRRRSRSVQKRYVLRTNGARPDARSGAPVRPRPCAPCDPVGARRAAPRTTRGLRVSRCALWLLCHHLRVEQIRVGRPRARGAPLAGRHSVTSGRRDGAARGRAAVAEDVGARPAPSSLPRSLACRAARPHHAAIFQRHSGKRPSSLPPSVASGQACTSRVPLSAARAMRLLVSRGSGSQQGRSGCVASPPRAAPLAPPPPRPTLPHLQPHLFFLHHRLSFPSHITAYLLSSSLCDALTSPRLFTLTPPSFFPSLIFHLTFLILFLYHPTITS